jgi:hypothetical protein
MSDRELLELAAKAAGDLIGFDPDGSCHIGIPGTSEMLPWNPLTDDGDALRLAVTLKMDESITSPVWVMERTTIGEYERDPYAATRRAIVRAAAEIARGMGARSAETAGLGPEAGQPGPDRDAP